MNFTKVTNASNESSSWSKEKDISDLKETRNMNWSISEEDTSSI